MSKQSGKKKPLRRGARFQLTFFQLRGSNGKCSKDNFDETAMQLFLMLSACAYKAPELSVADH